MTREIEHLKGLDLIVEERLRQVEDLGYTVEHDADCTSVAELMRISQCYIEVAAEESEGNDVSHYFYPSVKPGRWPRGTSIPWRPEQTPMENAAKGAAFAAAALDLMNAELRGEV